MGNESSNNNSNDNGGCDHNFNSNDMRYDHYPGDTFETVHHKNEVNSALDRVEYFDASDNGALSSAVQSFQDGHTLTRGSGNIERGCGKCKDDNRSDRDRGRDRKESKHEKKERKR